MQNLSKQKQLSQTASPYQERTLISVRLGSEMTQIWIEGGIVYAPLARLMRYAGRESGLTPKVREQVGEDHFLKVLVNDKQEHWFVSLAGFTEVAKRISISAADYHNILIMYGDREPDPLPEWAYCFTEGEMLDIIKVVNRRPINKSDIIESLLNGKKR